MESPQVNESQSPGDEDIDFTNEIASIKYRSEYSPMRTPPPKNSVFLIDESTYHPVMPKISHWSIAWSDLMMTMFILFLSLFIYQATHKDFLVTEEIEVMGGDTSDALEITDDGGSGFPFVPIEQGAPLVTSGTVKKIEPVSIHDIDEDTRFVDDKDGSKLDKIRKKAFKPLPPIIKKETVFDEPFKKPEFPNPTPSGDNTPQDNQKSVAEVEQPTIEPEPVADQKTAREPKKQAPNIAEIFTINKENLEQYNLEKFAEVRLIPDKTVRIILTGDLLFPTGSADLSNKAIKSLDKIALALSSTPYMINVVGHTDNVPMKSERFSSNWELSLSRASSVARFLIEDVGMSPSQFVVSGYSSYRPVAPNTNTKNRAMNRRVEIIISKRLPKPLPATQENFQKSEQ
jgi:chemotaxis protein MotB